MSSSYLLPAAPRSLSSRILLSCDSRPIIPLLSRRGMPPGPAYNWFCVASSLVDVLSNAARIRANQVAAHAPRRAATEHGVRKARMQDLHPELEEHATLPPNLILKDKRGPGLELPGQSRNVLDTRGEQEPATGIAVGVASSVTPSPAEAVPAAPEPILSAAPVPQEAPTSQLDSSVETSAADLPLPTVHVTSGSEERGPVHMQSSNTPLLEEPALRFESVEASPSSPLASEATVEATVYSTMPEADPLPVTLEAPVTRHLQSSKVPSSRIGRLFHYGGLAASLGMGAASELLRRGTGGESNAQSLMLTEANVKRLVSKLTQLRGAALKLGQFMSIQDTHVLPPEIEDIFRRVQDSAHYMPDWQMEEVMRASLGPSWQGNFESFERLPFAAASIGQVHRGVLAAHASPTGAPATVAVKIQFPNIASSIESDLGYVKALLTAGRLLPRGLFLDKTLVVMKEELRDECDYAREASFMRRFGQGLAGDERFRVPWAWEGSSDRVLVMEYVEGVSVGGSQIGRLPQRERDEIAARIIELCLRELFEFRAMQTDPNWTNFLWDAPTRQIALVDFGATREYSKEFIDDWLRLLSAAAADDHDACVALSRKVGYLTGEENQMMLDAHVKSLTLLSTPFKAGTVQPVAFGRGSHWAGVTAEIRELIPVMLSHRLTPPPRETYSLNRKLSGAFLLASRLEARVDCRSLWEKVTSGYQFTS